MMTDKTLFFGVGQRKNAPHPDPPWCRLSPRFLAPSVTPQTIMFSLPLQQSMKGSHSRMTGIVLLVTKTENRRRVGEMKSTFVRIDVLIEARMRTGHS